MVHKVAAHGDIILNLSLNQQKLEAEAKDTCKRLLREWAELGNDQIQVAEISGGITNLLWKLKPPKGESVVLRVFGKQTDKIIDREKEKKVLHHLNAAGFGAQVLATFENGRIEAFLPYRALKPEEMVHRKMASCIARRLRHFHQVQIDAPAEPTLFPTIGKWLQQARHLDFGGDATKAGKYHKIDFDLLERELARVREAAEKLAPSTCYAHNDLLSGNVLVPDGIEDDKQLEEVQFIDFEYTDFSYRTFDIANHFNEYAGFECDYSRFPDHDHITYFVQEYLQEGSSEPIGKHELEKGVAECYVMALASHQFWGTWAILQAKYSPIDFDYMGYIKLRWDEYFRRRDEFLSRSFEITSP